MRDLHASQIKVAVEAVKARKEVNEVYFVACGGSQAVLMAGQYMFDKESSIPSHVYTANEFVYDTPKRLNENSVVISCSHSGKHTGDRRGNEACTFQGRPYDLLIQPRGVLHSGRQQSILFTMTGVKEVSDSDKNKGILYGLTFQPSFRTRSRCEVGCMPEGAREADRSFCTGEGTVQCTGEGMGEAQQA